MGIFERGGALDISLARATTHINKVTLNIRSSKLGRTLTVPIRQAIEPTPGATVATLCPENFLAGSRASSVDENRHVFRPLQASGYVKILDERQDGRIERERQAEKVAMACSNDTVPLGNFQTNPENIFPTE